MARKILYAFIVVIALIDWCMPSVYADSRDDEIRELKKMVQKLTARIERLEMKQSGAGEDTVRASGNKIVKSSGVPAWLDRIKLKGDVRYRNEWQKPGSGAHIYRQRIKTAVGIEGKITDTVKGGIGITTGSNGAGSGRSKNATLTGSFGNYDLNLDYAYIQWDPTGDIKISAGKIIKPLYCPDQLLWDSDINFDGASMNSRFSLEEMNIAADLYLNTGFFMVDYAGASSQDVYLASIQGGIGSSVDDMIDWKLIVGYLDFIHIQNSKAAAMTPASGIANAEGVYAHDYNVLEISGETTLHFMEDNMDHPFDKPLTLFGDYAFNTTGGTKDIDGYDKKSAWQAGVKYGEKPSAAWEWNAGYNYVWFERNAFPDEFPNADMVRGRTDGFGNKVWFNVGLARNWWLGFTYYALRDKTLSSDPSNENWGQIFQADVNVKF